MDAATAAAADIEARSTVRGQRHLGPRQSWKNSIGLAGVASHMQRDCGCYCRLKPASLLAVDFSVKETRQGAS